MHLNLDDEDNLNFDIEDFKDIEEILNDSYDNSDNFLNKFTNNEFTSIDELTNDNEFTSINNDEEPKKKESKYSLITKRIDSSRIRHKTVKNVEVYTSLLKNVKLELENPTRCGAIVYTHHKGKTYFCLGVDSSYGDLTDFSGGIKKGETVFDGGLRELKEESQGVFGEIKKEDIQDCMTFYSKNMVIIFIEKNVDMEDIKREFLERVKGKTELEVSNIFWIEKQDFINSINGKGKRIYSRVRKILSKVPDIISAI